MNKVVRHSHWQSTHTQQKLLALVSSSVTHLLHTALVQILLADTSR